MKFKPLPSLTNYIIQMMEKQNCKVPSPGLKDLGISKICTVYTVSYLLKARVKVTVI